MFIQTGSTPNPPDAQFLPGKVPSWSRVLPYYRSRQKKRLRAFGRWPAKLFGIPGVTGRVLRGYDFSPSPRMARIGQHLNRPVLGPSISFFIPARRSCIGRQRW